MGIFIEEDFTPGQCAVLLGNLLSKMTSPSFGEWEPWGLVMRIKRGKMV